MEVSARVISSLGTSRASASRCNSNRPQRSAAIRAAETIAQAAEDSAESTDDALKKKKKTPAAFQLSAKVIPDDAGHIKVSAPRVALACTLTMIL
jgi:hypothetical protein